MTNVFLKKRRTILSYKNLRESRTERIEAGRRLKLIFDEGTFVPLFTEMKTKDPLQFPGYEDKRRELENRSGENDALVAGVGLVGGRRVCAAELDRQILMGSMGTVVGEKLVCLIEMAGREKLPLVVFSASGGARMQEGLYSLMQMAKTSAAVRKFRREGGLFISVLTHPTTGGVSASFASLGDIILAEPGALIGFAGPRVIEQTIRKKLPEGFQRAEFQMEHGFVDKIVDRKDMKKTLIRILRLHEKRPLNRPVAAKMSAVTDTISDNAVTSTTVGADKLTTVSETVNATTDKTVADGTTDNGSAVPENGGAADKLTTATADTTIARPLPASGIPPKDIPRSDLSAYERLSLVRSADRPKVTDYISAIFDEFMEMCGDRLGREDASLLGGVAMLDGMPVTVIGHRKGKTAKENLACNFGMTSPEGYRKALRLMEQAEKFGRPVITFIDTPGAYPGMEAEEHGQSIAIAENLARMSDLKVPIIAIVTGEGNSGGALAIGVADEVWMLENAVYAILSPEGFASILWKDAAKAPKACEIMKITSHDLFERGLIDRIVAEGPGGIQKNFENDTARLRHLLVKAVRSLAAKDPEELAAERYLKYRTIEGDMRPFGAEEVQP
ncbi:MAG: acetyl-CoA carboxylase carboxyltransferase subunit alpha [Lachnospiraceae bacterium]|nr:acetyl-CoA carboxylase carboxyltransferase subunit alpha [Lachnospiraceae bacterium]